MNCADPANTSRLIPSACTLVSPALTIATPVTSPHGATPTVSGIALTTPSRKVAYASGFQLNTLTRELGAPLYRCEIATRAADGVALRALRPPPAVYASCPPRAST